jgi:hypothetical protein
MHIVSIIITKKIPQKTLQVSLDFDFHKVIMSFIWSFEKPQKEKEKPWLFFLSLFGICLLFLKVHITIWIF